MTTVALLAGLVLLTLGADVLIRSASAIALAMRISPLVVGLTVVAFGTSAPELAVSIDAALNGQADIALGNVVGSNIFNVLFILGVSSVLVPLVVNRQLVRFDVPLMIAVSALTYWLGRDGVVSRLEGGVLALGLIGYTWHSVRAGRRHAAEAAAASAEFAAPQVRTSPARLAGHVVLTIVGLALLVIGSRLFVGAAIDIARGFGVSELVIGLTLVAAGTSLPEVATSVLATIKGERDIAVGNVVGSNIFNILGVLGISSALSPSGVAVAPTALALDIPVMIAVAAMCLPVFYTGRCIARWEGIVFLIYYAAYVLYLCLAASDPAQTGTLALVMFAGVIPVATALSAVGVMRQRRESRATATQSLPAGQGSSEISTPPPR